MNAKQAGRPPATRYTGNTAMAPAADIALESDDAGADIREDADADALRANLMGMEGMVNAGWAGPAPVPRGAAVDAGRSRAGGKDQSSSAGGGRASSAAEGALMLILLA